MTCYALQIKGTLPDDKRAEFDTAQARIQEGRGSGGAVAATAAKSMPTDPVKLAKIQKIMKITEEQLQRLPANAAAQIRTTQAMYRVAEPSKKRLLHSGSGKHTVNIERLPGYAANEEAAATDAAYAASQAKQNSARTGAGAGVGTSAGAGSAVHDGNDVGAGDVDSPPSAQPRSSQHAKRAKTDAERVRDEEWDGLDPPAVATSSGYPAKKLCPHCKGPTIAPFSAPCGHIACYSCWKEITNKGSVNGQFPCADKSCKHSLRKKQLRKCHF